MTHIMVPEGEGKWVITFKSGDIARWFIIQLQQQNWVPETNNNLLI